MALSAVIALVTAFVVNPSRRMLSKPRIMASRAPRIKRRAAHASWCQKFDGLYVNAYAVPCLCSLQAFNSAQFSRNSRL